MIFDLPTRWWWWWMAQGHIARAITPPTPTSTHYYLSVTDLGMGADLDAARQQTTARTHSEAGAGMDATDAVQVALASMTETGAGMDDLDFAARLTLGLLAESGAGAENFSGVGFHPASFSDDGLGLDVMSRMTAGQRTRTDSGGGLDDQHSAHVTTGHVYLSAMAERGGGSEDLGHTESGRRTAGERGHGSDLISHNSSGVFTRHATDGGGGSDSIARTESGERFFADSGAGAEGIHGTATHAVISVSRAVAETGQMTDHLAESGRTYRLIHEPAGVGVETYDEVALLFRRMRETGSATETGPAVDRIHYRRATPLPQGGADDFERVFVGTRDLDDTGYGAQWLGSGHHVDVSESGIGNDLAIGAGIYQFAIAESGVGYEWVMQRRGLANNALNTITLN